MAWRALLLVVALLVGCGDGDQGPRAPAATIRTIVVATAPDATVPPDPAAVAEAGQLARHLAAVQAAVDGGPEAKVVAAVAAMRTARPAIKDPSVAAAWDRATVGTTELATVAARLAAQPSPAARAGYLCDMASAQRTSRALGVAGVAFGEAAKEVASRLAVPLAFPSLDRPATLTAPAALAASAWGCVVGLRPIVHALNGASGATAIVGDARTIERLYDGLRRGVAGAATTGTRPERVALGAVGTWASIESQLMRLVIRSWQRHDVARRAFTALTRRETVAGKRLVAALRAVGVDARLR